MLTGKNLEENLIRHAMLTATTKVCGNNMEKFYHGMDA